MLEETSVKTLDKVVIRFSGDSGDGMQLVGNIYAMKFRHSPTIRPRYALRRVRSAACQVFR